MTISRRQLTTLLAGLPMAAAWPHAMAQARKDSVVLGMVLEPPGLDPTIAPAAAIGEIVHYNVLEGLTKINVDGKRHAAAGRELER
jgi:peptide/nickel transport system substrate-binding protein